MDHQQQARALANIILQDAADRGDGLADTIQHLLSCVVDADPCKAPLMELVLQYVCETLEPDQAIL